MLITGVLPGEELGEDGEILQTPVLKDAPDNGKMIENTKETALCSISEELMKV